MVNTDKPKPDSGLLKPAREACDSSSLRNREHGESNVYTLRYYIVIIKQNYRLKTGERICLLLHAAILNFSSQWFFLILYKYLD